MTADQTPDWLSAVEVAKKLRINKMTVYRLIHAGDLVAYKFGDSFRVDPADFAAYIQASRVGGAR